jgi:hypothetical protein
MSAANPTMASATAAPRPATPVAPNHPSDAAQPNGHAATNHDNRPNPAPPAAVPGKKGKQKKAPEPTEASKLIAQRISQLELDAAGEKDQEAEIGVYLCPSLFRRPCVLVALGERSGSSRLGLVFDG